jgi:hypothetical protein
MTASIEVAILRRVRRPLRKARDSRGKTSPGRLKAMRFAGHHRRLDWTAPPTDQLGGKVVTKRIERLSGRDSRQGQMQFIRLLQFI